MSYKTYEELGNAVVASPTHSLRVHIGPVEVGGTYDSTTRILVWQAEFAVRNEEYVKNLLSIYGEAVH